MKDFINNLTRDKKKLLTAVGFIILIAGIPVVLYLVRNPQILKSRAAGANSRIAFLNSNNQEIQSTSTQQVKLRLYWDSGTQTESQCWANGGRNQNDARLWCGTHHVGVEVVRCDQYSTDRDGCVLGGPIVPNSPSPSPTVSPSPSPSVSGITYRVANVASPSNCTDTGLNALPSAQVRTGQVQDNNATVSNFTLTSGVGDKWICAQFIVNGVKRDPMITGVRYIAGGAATSGVGAGSPTPHPPGSVPCTGGAINCSQCATSSGSTCGGTGSKICYTNTGSANCYSVGVTTSCTLPACTSSCVLGQICTSDSQCLGSGSTASPQCGTCKGVTGNKTCQY